MPESLIHPVPADGPPADGGELQFDRVDRGRFAPDAASLGMSCPVCRKEIGAEYYQINGQPVYKSCLSAVEAATTRRGLGPLLRAGLFGLGAAIAGAALYYAVLALAHLEIGLVAIVIGYMVGYSVRKGAGGRGGRRFQVLALVLAYWAVGLAYAPLAFHTQLTQMAPTGPTAVGVASLLYSLGVVFLLVFALPVLAIVGSMPGGILSALIIFFGLRQAWRMTAAPALEVFGPYKVGRDFPPRAAD
jgi:hypothetical protein